MYCGFTAGLFGGILSMAVGYPFDTIKVHQQTRQSGGMVSSAKSIVMSCGPLGLFKGMTLPLVSSGIMNGMFFGSYEFVARKVENHYYKDRLDKQRQKEEGKLTTNRFNYSLPSIIVGGTVAGLSQILIGCPVELLKIKMQLGVYARPTDVLKSVSSFKVASSLIQMHGIKSLYQGWSMMVLREVPSSILYMLTYQETSKVLRKLFYSFSSHSYRDPNRNSFLVAFLSGGTAGAVSALSSVPFDVLKSRIQASHFETTAKTRLTFHFRSLYIERGLAGFTRGWFPLVLRSFPVNGAAFVAYEIFMHMCNTRNILFRNPHE